MNRVIAIISLLLLGVWSPGEAQTVVAPGEGTSVREGLLVGQWELVGHTVDYGQLGPYEEATNIIPPGYHFTYTFHKDGTYMDESEYKSMNIPNYAHSGKWQLTNGGNTLLLTEIQELPSILDTQLPDLELEIKQLTETELIMPEYMFFDTEAPGISYYSKIIEN